MRECMRACMLLWQQDDDLAQLRDTREWIETLTEVKGGLSRNAKLDLRTEAKVCWSLQWPAAAMDGHPHLLSGCPGCPCCMQSASMQEHQLHPSPRHPTLWATVVQSCVWGAALFA